MTKEDARYYLRSSGFSEEQINTIEQAFKQECVEPTQKHVGNALDMRCDDAISRKDIQDYIAKYLSQYLYEDVRQAVEAIDTYIGDMPSVTQKPDKYRKEAKRWKNKWLKSQKSGHWIEENHDEYELWICSECGAYTELDMSEEYGCGWKFCPKCGARMFEPQESEVNNG